MIETGLDESFFVLERMLKCGVAALRPVFGATSCDHLQVMPSVCLNPDSDISPLAGDRQTGRHSIPKPQSTSPNGKSPNTISLSSPNAGIVPHSWTNKGIDQQILLCFVRGIRRRK